MPAPTSTAEFLDFLRKSDILEPKRLEPYLKRLRDTSTFPETSTKLAEALVKDAFLTRFQAEQILLGKWRNFTISGKYKLLERLGSGGMGAVFLCEHKVMRRLVALKVLPTTHAEDPASLERFHREARAVAQLHHPNIVGAYDIDQDGKLHFLVMEYVEGSSLQEIIRRTGPMDPLRSAHYISQAAVGLQAAFEKGLVHRDIKPGNILVDRSGTVKILDMGLARFFRDEEDNITKKYDESVLGTADYLAPEQAVESHTVDIRADIYSLGITFYFLLTGSSPFKEGTVAQKLIWHQLRTPRPIPEIRPGLPEGLVAVVDKMIAKEPAKRFQLPIDVAAALAPWTATPIPPPPEEEMPLLTPALRSLGQGDTSASSRPGGGTGSTFISSFQVQQKGSSASQSGAPSFDLPAASGTSIPAGAESTGIKAAIMSTPRPAQTRIAGNLGEQPSSAGMTMPSRETTKLQNDLTVSSLPDQETTGTELFSRNPQRKLPTIPGSKQWLPWIMALIAALVVLVAAGAGITYLWLGLGKTQQTTLQANQTRPDTSTAPLAISGTVTITKRDDGSYRVQGKTYEAVLGPQGNLDSLAIGGREYLRSGLPLEEGKSLSHGAYFFFSGEGHQGAVKLETIRNPEPNVLTAAGDKFSIRYEFAPESLTLKANNSTDVQVPFYIILDPVTVTDVIPGLEEMRAVPFERKAEDPSEERWQTTTWIAGNSRLKIRGGSKIWGPWQPEKLQVWETRIDPYATAAIDLETSIVPGTVGTPTIPPGGIVLRNENRNTRHVFTENYEAVIEGDGAMTSLRVNDVEFLRSGVGISRGAYFHPGQPGPAFKLPDVRQPADNVVSASGDAATIRYEFGPDKMTWSLENKLDKGIAFFLLLDTTVQALKNTQGDWLKTPTVENPPDPKWQTTTFFAGPVKLTLTGGIRVWGPWEKLYQVWETDLGPHEQKTITLETGRATREELAKVSTLTGSPVVSSDLVLGSPMDYQVFQRNSRLDGQIAFNGRVFQPFDKVEVRLTGKSLEGPLPGAWQSLPQKNAPKTFATTLPTPAGGWYRVEVRVLNDKQEVAHTAVEHVGVGEVFVGAGQSNSTNCGEVRIQQKSGMVASFSGTHWQPADDPQPGCHDNTTGGSFWPAFGDALYEKIHVPIGVAATGHSGTSVTQWQPGGELFNWMMTRIYQLGPNGFRAVLWHQGESDVGKSTEEYVHLLTNLIQGSKKSAGWDFPWMVAQATYHTPKEVSDQAIRAAQKQLWTTGLALEGPDTDTLTGDNRDQNGQGIHFSPKGLHAHGQLWADKVALYLENVLKK